MALLHPRPTEFAPHLDAEPLVSLQLSAGRSLEDLRPGDSVELLLHGSRTRGASIALSGPSPRSFAVTSCAEGERTRFTAVAEAPGVARLTVVVQGSVLRHVTLVCRAPALDGFARCERAGVAHRARLAALGSFATSVLEELDHARRHVVSAQRARMMEVRELSEARTLAVLLSDPMDPDVRDPLRWLRETWARVTCSGVATRAIAILAPGELMISSEPTPPPATLRQLIDGLQAAIAREERWVTALLEAWPLRLRGMTARAPDRELAAGVAPCPTDATPLRAAYWRAWFYEHALAIRPAQEGAHAAWRTSRGLLDEVAAELPSSWRAAIAADVDAIAAAANALGVL